MRHDYRMSEMELGGGAAPVLRGQFLYNEPMKKHVSWRAGGVAKRVYIPADLEDLTWLVRSVPAYEEIHMMGLGSNLLVRDGGFPGAVVNTSPALDTLERCDEGIVIAGAGVPCAKLARACVRWQLGPAYFFAGIPGTVGGALTMNAGAFGGETWDAVRRVETVDRTGARRWREPTEYEIGYRRVKAPAAEWFLHAEFGFDADPMTNAAGIKELMAKRKATQPIGLPSCGSVFRNPPGDHAARLIEAAGLKGHSIGAAQVSPKHANFIINTGGATATEIERLIEHVRSEVRSMSGVTLVCEVRIVGEKT